MEQNVLVAFALTTVAGLFTGIGSTFAFFSKRTNKKIISFVLGFSAGVMLYVSFLDIIPNAIEILSKSLSIKESNFFSAIAFFGGFILIMLIDKIFPEKDNPHHTHQIEEVSAKSKKLYKMGIITAFTISLHNFPEGFAAFSAYILDPQLGLSILLAIAIHNIPVGISISIPIYIATGSRTKAFWYSFLSGLAEPIGAIIGYMMIKTFFDGVAFGILFSIVAGILVYVALEELLPSARENDSAKISIYGLLSGMVFIGISLLLID